MKKAIIGSFLCLTLVTLCSTPGTSADQKIHPQRATANAPQLSIPSQERSPEMKELFSNLAGDRTKLYDGANGYFVSGPHNLLNSQKQDIAIPFRASFEGSIIAVRLALQHYPYGANQATVAIFNDVRGLPGGPLAKQDVKNLEAFGSGCCKLATWRLAKTVAVTKDTQYWIVVTTDKATFESVNSWNLVSDDKPGNFAVQINNGGWDLAAEGNPPPAVAVYGIRW